MDGLIDGAHSGLSEAEYGRVVSKAIGRLRQLNPKGSIYTRKDIACAGQVLAHCDLLRLRLCGVRQELELSSRDPGYQLAVAMFHKAHQVHSRQHNG